MYHMYIPLKKQTKKQKKTQQPNKTENIHSHILRSGVCAE